MSLQRATLVLNRNWTPIHTTTVRQAIGLLCRSSAAVICPQTYAIYDLRAWLIRSAQGPLPRKQVLHTPTRPVEIPEVILLQRYGGMPARQIAFSRRNLFRRDGHCCQYCGVHRPPSELSIDHVLPRSRGGPTSWENCVLACVRCNSKKANHTPRESGLRLRRAPARPRWSPLHEILAQAQPESWERFLRRGA